MRWRNPACPPLPRSTNCCWCSHAARLCGSTRRWVSTCTGRISCLQARNQGLAAVALGALCLHKVRAVSSCRRHSSTAPGFLPKNGRSACLSPRRSSLLTLAARYPSAVMPLPAARRSCHAPKYTNLSSTILACSISRYEIKQEKMRWRRSSSPAGTSDHSLSVVFTP